MITARWTGVAGAALAGVLFLPAGIAVAAEPNIASCEQTKGNCVEHGNNSRVFTATRSGAKDEKRDDADPLGGAVATPAQFDCSSGTVTEAVALIDDSGVALVVGDASRARR